jgi:hypothetical protein
LAHDPGSPSHKGDSPRDARRNTRGAAEENAIVKPRRKYGLAVAIALLVFFALIAIRIVADLGAGPDRPAPPGQSSQSAPASPTAE